jgi:hypothetical protein
MVVVLMPLALSIPYFISVSPFSLVGLVVLSIAVASTTALVIVVTTTTTTTSEPK